MPAVVAIMAKSPPKEQIVVRVTPNELHALRIAKGQANCKTWADLMLKAAEKVEV